MRENTEPEKFKDVLNRISLDEFKEIYLNNNQSKTVEILNISWGNLKKFIKYYNIEKSSKDVVNSRLATRQERGNTKEKTLSDLCEKISKDNLINYYIKENHSMQETAHYFGVNQSAIIRLLKHYSIHKPTNEHTLRIKKSKLDKYGDENYNNREKAKETNIERYGVDNLFKDKEYIKECWENTLGVSHPMQREDIVQKAVEHKNYNKSKIKGSQTYFEKTGYTNPMKNPEVVQKMIESKIMNGVWEHPKVSNYKNKIVDSLQKVFGERDIVQHYRDKRYSRDTGYEFECDCYIKSLDLFIEINAYPTHYLHPFGIKEDDALIKKQLQKTNTDWSKRVLDAWCSRDVEKFNIAKKNNLNYLNVYTNTSLEENLLWNNAKYENILALILSIKRPRNKDSNSIDN